MGSASAEHDGLPTPAASGGQDTGNVHLGKLPGGCHAMQSNLCRTFVVLGWLTPVCRTLCLSLVTLSTIACSLADCDAALSACAASHVDNPCLHAHCQTRNLLHSKCLKGSMASPMVAARCSHAMWKPSFFPSSQGQTSLGRKEAAVGLMIAVQSVVAMLISQS